MHQHALAMRIIGFLTSLLLTLTAYCVMMYPESFHLMPDKAILAIFFLALLQATVQLLFFLDLWREEGPLWNLSFFLSTVSVIFVIIFFSIWIMDHLNENMMPM